MAENAAIFEEGTEITIDTEVEAAAAGWTLGHVNVHRVGRLVTVHIEATFANNAAATVTTLQSEFAPADTVTSGDKNWTVGANGVVSYTASRATGATVVLNVSYLAASVSP